VVVCLCPWVETHGYHHGVATRRIANTSQQVYDLLGSPDALEYARNLADPPPKPGQNEQYDPNTIPPGYDAWRYDWGPNPDLTLLIIWNSDKGCIAKAIAIRPGLWHGRELFDRKAAIDRDPAVSDIGTRGFLCKAEDFFAARGKEMGKK
jgi:hypothetical protein